MLVLTRRKGEILIIRSGEHTIEVRLLDLTGGQARIGIEAPPEVIIVRKEISCTPCRRKERPTCTQ